MSFQLSINNYLSPRWTPLFINSNLNSGYTPSLLIDQMVSSNPLDSMNLSMNEKFMNCSARSILSYTPIYNFNNFTPYCDSYNNYSYLCDPRYTMAQMTWGTPAWNNDFSNLWQNNFNWNGVSTNNGSSSNSTRTDRSTPDPTTDAEKRKYNKLKDFVKEFVKYQHLNPDSKDKLNEALNNNKGTIRERYQALSNAYKAVTKDNKSIVIDFLTDASSQIYDGDSNAKQYLYSRLLSTGFEYDTDLDKEIGKYYDALLSVSGADGNTSTKSSLIGYISGGTYDVLDAISSWNTRFAKKPDSDKMKIIAYAAQRRSAISDDNQKRGIETDINDLVSAMVSKATEVKSSLNTDSQDKIDKLIGELDNLKAQQAYDRISAKFEELYLVTRLAAHEILKNDLKTYYGEIDEDVFNDELLDDEIYADLTKEGFKKEQIDNAKVQLNGKISGRSTPPTVVDDIDTQPATEQVKYLVQQGALDELTCKKDGTVTVYQEKIMTGDSNSDNKADYQKLYYINENGKLVEWTNTKLNNDGTAFEAVKTGIVQKAVEVTPSSIISAQTEARTSGDNTEGNNLNIASCKRICELLCGWTGVTQAKEIAQRLNVINKDNVYILLEQFYDVEKPWFEGIMEKLEDDDEDKHITMDQKRQLLNSILAKAEELGLTNNLNYIGLQDTIKDFDKNHSDKSTFSVVCSNDSWRWCGFADTYDEVMDRYIKNLYKVMKATVEKESIEITTSEKVSAVEAFVTSGSFSSKI